MKIESIIVDREPGISSYLKKCLVSKFPEIAIRGEASSYGEACALIKTFHPDLIFSDVNIFTKNTVGQSSKNGESSYEMIYLSEKSEDAIQAIRQDVCGFLLKPLDVNDIAGAVGSAIRKLSQRLFPSMVSDAVPVLLPHTKLVGIPTLEGIDFLYAHEIVRCEGLQKCTRIVCTRKNNLISSYNVGEFRKLLEEYGFFSCHKSHLINLMHVRKFTREGFVFLIDNMAIPLARRRRLEFLHLLKHL